MQPLLLPAATFLLAPSAIPQMLCAQLLQLKHGREARLHPAADGLEIMGLVLRKSVNR